MGELPTLDIRYQLLIDAVTDYAISMLDPHGRIVSWNTGAQRFTGYTASEIVGQNFERIHTGEDRALGEPRRMLDIAAREGRIETEGWRVRKDGTQFWVHVIIDAIHAPGGELIGFAKITRDVTEQMRAREALLESERGFRLLVQGVTDYAIYMLDPDGFVTNWNLGAERIKQYKADEVVGQHFSKFYTDEDRTTGLPQRALETARREGKFDHEGWRVRKDGTRFWAGVVIDAIRDENGQPIGFAKITRDLTERRNTARQLEEAQQALFQAQKMEAIGQLTGGVAHDFNNLLTVVVSSLDLLRRRLDDPRDRRILDNALQAAERGSRLTGQLLAFARKQALRPEIHNPNQLIESFEAILRRGAGDDVTLELDLAPEINHVTVDQAQFEATLLNLVVNARDASAEDSTVRVKTETVTIDSPSRLLLSTIAPGVYVRISVSDTGHGMPPDVLAHVCEPFYTTKEIGKGTGLGLSQVYGFAGQSNGHLHIDTAEGEGTTVSLFLPAGDVVRPDARSTGGRAAAGTVLIVDDDAQVMSIAVEIFDSLGYDILTANDATEALDILMRDRPIDVLFSDVVMPRGMNGAELAHEARRMRPGIKIILVSGYPVAALEKSGASMADAAFISKPYRWTEIVERLRGQTNEPVEAL